MATEPARSGRLWASMVSVLEAHPSMMRRSSPVACVSKYPSGSVMRWSDVVLRMLVAQRKADRCVHMSAQKYTRMPSTANATATQAYWAMLAAWLQLGATATKSRATSQMQM